MIICIDGPDKVGKTTQCKILSELLNIPTFKFPHEGSALGKRIRSILNKEYPYESWSFQALMAMDKITYGGDAMKEIIRASRHIILDRYTPSAFAYGYAEGIPMGVSYEMNDAAVRPDITFIFEGEPFGQDNDIYGDHLFQNQVKEGYEGFCSQFVDEFHIVRIKSDRPIEEVTDDLMTQIAKKLITTRRV